MLIRIMRGWELAETAATPERLFQERRQLVKAMALGPILLAAGSGASRAFAATAGDSDPSAPLYPAPHNAHFEVDRPLSAEADITTFNNFYEFGSEKVIWREAQALPIRPWTLTIDGMVEKPLQLDIDDLLRRVALEERVYRHRCVEAWAMTVPWSGFPLRTLVEMARPSAGATYVRFETFKDPKVAGGQKQFWYPWPYVEGLTLAEATNELAFVGTGAYGKPMPKQNGAPLRLVLPWKYGFKSIKSIRRMTFTDQRPTSFWMEVAGNEYGFWANVNPDVPHARWSQATERLLGGNERVPTRLYNGYGPFVADMYAGIVGERLFT